MKIWLSISTAGNFCHQQCIICGYILFEFHTSLNNKNASCNSARLLIVVTVLQYYDTTTIKASHKQVQRKDYQIGKSAEKSQN